MSGTFLLIIHPLLSKPYQPLLLLHFFSLVFSQKTMQDFSAGDSSSPRPPPQTTRGRGRPTSDNIKIPWQVLELTGAAAGGAGGGSSAGGPVGDQVKKRPEDQNRSEGSPGRLVSHKRKHSQVIDQPQPFSPKKSPVQQEAPDDDEPPTSGDDAAAKKQSSGGDVAAQENAPIMEPSAAVIMVSEKEINEAVEEKNEEAEDIESFEAVEETNEEESSDDDAVTSELSKVMESFEAAEEEDVDNNNRGKDKEGAFETDAHAEEKNEEQEASAAEKEAIETTAEEKHEVSGEKSDDVAESSDDAEKRMKFLFDLNELPAVEEDDHEEGDNMP